MKTKFAFLPGIAALLLCACTKQELQQETTPEMSAPICIIAGTTESQTSKTHINDYPAGTTDQQGNYYWNLSNIGKSFDVFWDDSNEKMRLNFFDGQTYKDYSISSSYSLMAGGKTATFAFSKPSSLVTGKEYNFVSISPDSSVRPSNVIYLPETQNVRKRSVSPSGSSSVNTCYYDPASALLLSRCKKAVLTNTPVQLHMEYERITALTCLTMKNMPRGVFKVEIQFKKGGSWSPIAGGRSFNLFTSTPGSFADSKKTSITLNCKDDKGNNTFFEANPDVWFNSWELVLGSGDQILVTAYSVANKYTASLTIGSGKSLYLIEGSMNHFTVNFEDGRTGVSKVKNAPQITLSTGVGKMYFGKKSSHKAPVEYTTVAASNPSGNPFWPGFDQVRIRVQEAQTEANHIIEVVPDLYYEVTPTEIHINFPAWRVGQHIQLYLYRGTKERTSGGLITSYDPTEYYPLFNNYSAPTSSGFNNSNWVQLVDPESENPQRFCIVDPALAEQLKKSRGYSVNCGLAAKFDDYGAVTSCGSTGGGEFAITGGSFKTFRDMAAFNAFKTNLGSLSDQRTGSELTHNPAFRIWTNLSLAANASGKVVADFSNWNAAVNPYNYHQLNSSGETTVTKSTIHELYLGPNMTGYRWLMDSSTPEDDFVETIDCSKSSEVHYIIHYGKAQKLKLLDLRVKGKSGQNGGEGTYHKYTRLCNKSYVALGCLNTGLNMSQLTIRINKDVYDRSRPYRWVSGNDQKSRVFAYYIAVYLKKCAQGGAKIEVYENDWNGGGRIEAMDNFKDGYWDIANDGNIGTDWPTLPSGEEYNTWPLYATPKTTYEDGNYQQ